jgi:hypothetical protein
MSLSSAGASPMSRTIWIRSLGIAVVALVALSIGARPSLRAGQPSAVVSSAAVGGAFGGGDEDLKQQTVYLAAHPMTALELKVRMKLLEKIPMNFPNDTPLADIKKYIEESTRDKTEFPDGISIYVDPQGLSDTDKTMESTVRIDLKGQPLEATLRLLLKQLGLTYDVSKDGLLCITANQEPENLTPAELDAEILTQLSALRSEVRSLRDEVRSLQSMEPVPSRGSTRGVGPSMGTVPQGGMGTKGGMM